MNSAQILERRAPAALATTAAESVSERYLVIPNHQIIEGFEDNGFVLHSASQQRARTEEGRQFGKHRLVFRQRDVQPQECVLGMIIPQYALTNSHNGRSSLQLDLSAERQVCLNGLTVSEGGQAVRFPHRGNGHTLDDILRDVGLMVQDFPRVIGKMRLMRERALTAGERKEFGRRALELRFEANEDGEYPVTADQVLRPRRYEDGRSDVWSTFNVLQENLIKGGLSARTVTPRGVKRASTRKVTGLDADLKINRGLWALAEEFAGLQA